MRNYNQLNRGLSVNTKLNIKKNRIYKIAKLTYYSRKLTLRLMNPKLYLDLYSPKLNINRYKSLSKQFRNIYNFLS